MSIETTPRSVAISFTEKSEISNPKKRHVSDITNQQDRQNIEFSHEQPLTMSEQGKANRPMTGRGSDSDQDDDSISKTASQSGLMPLVKPFGKTPRKRAKKQRIREPTSQEKRKKQPEKPHASGVTIPTTKSQFYQNAATRVCEDFQRRATKRTFGVPPELLFNRTSKGRERPPALVQNDRYFDYRDTNDGFVFGGFGDLLENEGDPEIDDFRTVPWATIRPRCVRLVAYILSRPMKQCLRPKRASYAEDNHTSCLCFMDHRRCIQYCMPTLGSTNPQEIPEVVLRAYEKLLRLLLGMRFITSGRWSLDDVFFYLCEYFIVSQSFGQQKAWYYVSMLFQTNNRSIQPLQGAKACFGFLFELVGTRIFVAGGKGMLPTSFSIPGPRLKIPQDIINDENRLQEFCVRPSLIVRSGLLLSDAFDLSRNKLIATMYDRRDVNGRELLIAPPGYELAARRIIFFRYDKSIICPRQVLYNVYCQTMEEKGMCEMYEEPQGADVWNNLYYSHGNLISGGQFKQYLADIASAIVSPIGATSSSGVAGILPISSRVKAWCLATHKSVYEYPDDIYNDARYEDFRAYIRQPWSKKTLRCGVDFTIEHFADVAATEKIVESLYDWRNGDGSTLSDDKKNTDAHQRRLLSKIGHCIRSRQIASTKNPGMTLQQLMETDTVVAHTVAISNPTSDPTFVKSVKGEYDFENGYRYKKGLQNILFAIYGKWWWKASNFQCKHVNDCLVVKVPDALHSRLDILHQCIIHKHGIGPLSLLRSGLVRMNANDNLFVARKNPETNKPMGLVDFLREYLSERQLNSAEEEALLSDLKSFCDFQSEYEHMHTEVYLHSVQVDPSKNTMEAMRLEYPVDVLESINPDDCVVKVVHIPISPEGCTRTYFPYPFDLTKPTQTQPTDAESSDSNTDDPEAAEAARAAIDKAFTGCTTQIMPGSMVIQPLTLLFADGLNTSGRSNWYLTIVVVCYNSQIPELGNRASPQCYWGESGAIEPTSNEIEKINLLSSSLTATTNALNKDQDLPTVKYFTPSKPSTRQAQLSKQGGGYLPQKFCPALVYGYSENLEGFKTQEDRNTWDDEAENNRRNVITELPAITQSNEQIPEPLSYNDRGIPEYTLPKDKRLNILHRLALLTEHNTDRDESLQVPDNYREGI